ncbi:DUF2188 domain-containing protein [Methylobacter tundripaludum]|uniref:DUF2188 domain-containing protein n=1 Tax=Methylobacter tundripaludum TaxID=173365 RepID=UPI0004DF7E2E|nr:DUF2188 domain-containing protein [Methylobacter tundripaludum]
MKISISKNKESSDKKKSLEGKWQVRYESDANLNGVYLTQKEAIKAARATSSRNTDKKVNILIVYGSDGRLQSVINPATNQRLIKPAKAKSSVNTNKLDMAISKAIQTRKHKKEKSIVSEKAECNVI